jgi:hypothetical protein
MIRTIKTDEDFTLFFSQFEQDSKCITIDREYAQKFYMGMIARGEGQLFLLTDDEGNMQGGLGCIKGPTPHNGKIVAVELFWYTSPENRNTFGAYELLKAYEQWAKDNDCHSCALIHLADSQPERLEKLYLSLGYKLLEKHYIKEV